MRSTQATARSFESTAHSAARACRYCMYTTPATYGVRSSSTPSHQPKKVTSRKSAEGVWSSLPEKERQSTAETPTLVPGGTLLPISFRGPVLSTQFISDLDWQLPLSGSSFSISTSRACTLTLSFRLPFPFSLFPPSSPLLTNTRQNFLVRIQLPSSTRSRESALVVTVRSFVICL